MRHLHFNFEVKKAKNNAIKIAGYANAATIDRGKDFMTTDGWELDNYAKNPVVLFDHGHDPQFGSLPIGKAVVVRPEEKGLYTEVELSSSKAEKISAVRDLVEEGILKTFSVGFDPKESQRSKDGSDVNLITKKELLEISIVPIPMNQDSTFSMIKKKNLSIKSELAKKWIENFTKRVALVKKGAFVAAAIHQRLSDLLETGEIRNREAALKFIAEESGLNQSDIKEILAGNKTPLDQKTLQAFANVLRLDLSMLKNLNDGDVALLERVMLREENENKNNTEDQKTMKVKTNCEGENTKKEGSLKIGAVCFPKASFENIDQLKQAAAAAGYKTDEMDENETEIIFYQNGKQNLDGASKLDLGNGVYALLVSEGQQQTSDEVTTDQTDQTDQEPQEMSKDAKAAEGDQQEFSKDELDAAKIKWEDDKKATEENKDGNPASWVADEELWAKAKRASEAALGKVDFAFVTWWYLNHGGTKKSQPATDEKSIKEMQDDNPYLQEARQSNVLLGTLIKEIQILSEKMNGLADLSVNLGKKISEDKTEVENQDSNEVSKSIDLILNYKRDLDYKLKSINL